MTFEPQEARCCYKNQLTFIYKNLHIMKGKNLIFAGLAVAAVGVLMVLFRRAQPTAG